MDQKLQVKVKRLNTLATIPKAQKLGDVGLDITATSYKFIDGKHVYGTGLALEIPSGFYGMIACRSSISKYDLRLTNAVGIIDENYRGEIKFVFENRGMSLDFNPVNFAFGIFLYPKEKIYKIGDRIGQLIVMKYPSVELVEADELSETERGSGGFGSSGT